MSEVRPVILVIEDEADLREMISLTLSERGYEVVTAPTGDVALAIARTRSFDLAICDMKVPGLDGIATTRGLREIAPGLPVVIATGYLSEDALAACAAQGACAHLRKPFELRELREVVAAVLAP